MSAIVLFTFITSIAEARPLGSYLKVSCGHIGSEPSFYYMLNDIPCIAADGSQNCENQGFFNDSEGMLKCRNCCRVNDTKSTPKMVSPSPPMVVKTKTLELAPTTKKPTQGPKRNPGTSNSTIIVSILSMLAAILIGVFWCYRHRHQILEWIRRQRGNQSPQGEGGGAEQGGENLFMLPCGRQYPGIPPSTTGNAEESLDPQMAVGQTEDDL